MNQSCTLMVPVRMRCCISPERRYRRVISSSVVSTIRPVSVSIAGLSMEEAAAAALADESTPYSSAASLARRCRTASSFHSRL